MYNEEVIIMEKYDDCVYFLYPRDLNLKYVKYVLQRGFVVSLDTPRLMSDDYVQTFTEEDVKRGYLKVQNRKLRYRIRRFFQTVTK